jgi:hypothetical protein
MEAANTEALPFRVTLYCGTMQVTGRVAPASWLYRVSATARAAELEAAAKTRSRPAWRPGATSQGESAETTVQQLNRALSAAEAHEAGTGADELALVDVFIYPADFRGDTKTGGQALPVARIPLQAIDLWYVVSGETLKQAEAGGGFTFGVLFPVGD